MTECAALGGMHTERRGRKWTLAELVRSAETTLAIKGVTDVAARLPSEPVSIR